MYIIYDIYYKYNAYIAYIFQFDLVTLLLMSFPRRILFGFIIKTRRVSIGGIVSLYMYIWREGGKSHKFCLLKYFASC